MSGSSDEIARLRRVAYGPGATAGERVEAEAALRALSVADHAHLEPVVVDASEPPASVLAPQEVEAMDEPPERAPGIRPFWLIPIVVAAIGVGAVGALGATGQLGNLAASPTPSPTVVASPPLTDVSGAPDAGDLKAADRWFEGEPGPLDVYPFPDQLELAHVDPANVRFMAMEKVGAVVVSAWAAKNAAGEFCLIAVLDAEGSTASSCIGRDDFARRGLAFGANDIMVSWDGNGVAVERTTH